VGGPKARENRSICRSSSHHSASGHWYAHVGTVVVDRLRHTSKLIKVRVAFGLIRFPGESFGTAAIKESLERAGRRQGRSR